MSAVELTAQNGSTVTIDEPVDGDCLSCGRRRDVAPLSVKQTDGVDTLHLCGSCLCAALGVHLARSAVAEHGWQGMFPPPVREGARPHGT